MTKKTVTKEVPGKLLEKLKMYSTSRSCLYLGGFLTDSENEKIQKKLVKFRHKEIKKIDPDYIEK